MAIFRKIHTSFWSDPFTSDLDRDKKLFYLYLLTNERTKQCGVYEITFKQISFDLGYSIDTVSKMITYFIKCGKIKYSPKTNEIGIGNWLKYNSSTSPTVKACINKEFSLVKDTVLIEYVKSMDTHSQEEQEEEQEQEEEKQEPKKKDIPTLDDFLNYGLSKNPKIKESLKLKYEAWVVNDWKDGNGKEIKNWKLSLLNTIPYLKENEPPKPKTSSGLQFGMM